MESLIVFWRHGEKSNSVATREGELTLLGRKQAWSVAMQLVDLLGKDAFSDATVISSPVLRVRQTGNIGVSGLGLDPSIIEFEPYLEWGPDTGTDNDDLVAWIVRGHVAATPLILFGHDGNLQNVLQLLIPCPKGYRIDRGDAVVMKKQGNSFEVIAHIKPQVPA